MALLPPLLVAAAIAALVCVSHAQQTVSCGAQTACPTTATCCHHNFSNTGWGCCPYANAVCCAGSYGLCCPAGTVCQNTGTYSANCIPASGSPLSAPQVCTPGPVTPPSSTMPSVIVIGDSVSIGYTPVVAQMLAGKVQVQHSPAAGGGGADDTSYGQQCIITLESFLRTSDFQQRKWDLITFNFGLHNLDTNATSLDEYEAGLLNITQRLLATGSKLLYVLTTPFMPLTNAGQPVVQELNERAMLATRQFGIPSVDLYTRVCEYCGVKYTNCSICDVSPCTYHYTPEGYNWIAQTMSEAILDRLGLGSEPSPIAPRIGLDAPASIHPQDDQFGFIDNGVIRLGVDLTRGGAIGFLADQHDPTVSVINCHDMGREVQLSFYAGPSFYNPPTPQYPNGACDKLFGNQPWPWNPIGAGDIDGNHGQILSYTNDGTSIHVVTKPLQWACHNISCECTFEQTITLVGTGAHVVATLHNARSDTTDYGPRSQELPAVYANGPFYRLMTYNGSAPFTNAPVDEYTTGFANNFWVPGFFPATEHWAALVNTDGWGMGVINVNTTSFLSGFAGQKGAGGPSDDPTGYIAPVANVNLPAQGTYQFEFYLVLGDLDTIRAYAYQVVPH